MPLRKNASPDEARAATELDNNGWDKFYSLTKAEAQNLLKEHPTRTWADTPKEKQTEMIGRINAHLRAASLAQVGDDVVKWRLSNTVHDQKRSVSVTKEVAATDTQEPSRAYDPVRDV
ncbi:hypothetical protein K504DRAFT_108823 [Pleomassaria siparia CBS 279.74]|uniref:Uncharacterized protein n=1 Tax=Pleomassaria siparia CBS 279.74 TaxID=1314801 RepID=A0A6G1JWV8_9PLEO|nr:hypothetical protein K504DRAFT_108823 [Pleomassaria siparia CBS 279.74]